MFSYGHPSSPQENDPRFESYEDALKAAEQYQNKHPWNGILAIWEDESGEVLALLFDGLLFLPA
jgi:ABC-type cobalt transport system substrate-binding protein